VAAIAFALGAWFLIAQQRQSWEHGIATTARLRADDLVAELQSGALPASVAVPVEDEAFAQIADERDAVVRASPNIAGEELIVDLDPAADGNATSRIEHTPVGDGAFQVVARRVGTANGDYTVLVGQSMEPAEDAVASLTGSLAVGLPAFVTMVALIAWIMVGRALRPVDRMRAEVENISAHSLHQRLRRPNTADEIAELATTMNTMLDRIDTAVAQQRRFVADASHELRSPLTAIRTQLEIAIAHHDSTTWERTAGELLADTMRLQRLVDDLLALARIDHTDAPLPHQSCDVDDVVLREVRRIRVRGAVGIDAHRVTAVQTMVDPEGIARVLRNLLDNAERHAASRVTVELHRDDDRVILAVTDDGPGIPADQRDHVFERFTRLDDARGRDTGGTGLGLAIAREIVRAHGGELRLRDTRTGASFEIELPADRHNGDE